MEKSCGKCVKEGGSCTLHKYDEEKKSWVRCPNADPATFYSNINNIPAKYRQTLWEDFQQKNEHYKSALQYAQTVYTRLLSKQFPKKSLLFSGQINSGKTMLSSILLRYLAISNFTVNITSLTILTDLYFSERAKFHEYFIPDVLVVQLGSEIANTSSLPIIQELFKERSNHNKYTLFTSKYFVLEMSKFYSKEFQDFFKSPLFKELQLK